MDWKTEMCEQCQESPGNCRYPITGQPNSRCPFQSDDSAMSSITKEMELILTAWKMCRSTFHQCAAEYVDRELENLVEEMRIGAPTAHPDDPLEVIYPKYQKGEVKWLIDDPIRDLKVDR